MPKAERIESPQKKKQKEENKKIMKYEDSGEWRDANPALICLKHF